MTCAARRRDIITEYSGLYYTLSVLNCSLWNGVSAFARVDTDRTATGGESAQSRGGLPAVPEVAALETELAEARATAAQGDALREEARASQTAAAAELQAELAAVAPPPRAWSGDCPSC